MSKTSPATPTKTPKETKGSVSAVPGSSGGSSGGIFDLHSTFGQVTFIAIVAAIAVLIQTLPRDFLAQIGRSACPNACPEDTQKSLQPPVIITPPQPSFVIYNPRSRRDDHLYHVKTVLKRLGFSQARNDSEDWDLMWAHDYPFLRLPSLREMEDYQVVNHFPGSGFITNKVDLALTESKYIPKAFRLPEDVDKFQEYVKEHPNKEFVQKHNQHRHIYLKTVPEINLSDNDTFIQEYMSNPLLVDGKKFDIGAYTVITSIDPLRAYVYHGDYLLRFCPVEYHPFSKDNVDKYVVGDDYTPIWEMESLKDFHLTFGFGMKDSLDAHLRTKGQEPRVIWEQIHDSIREVLLRKEHLLKNSLQRFRTRRNFFEFMRFDFIIDENLRVFLLEANMSPNLSSAHFKPNQLLYEQVIYNVLKLVGIGSALQRESLETGSSDEEAMQSSLKNIVVSANECAGELCRASCDDSKCKLCRQCLSRDDLAVLHAAYREHSNRGDMLRIFPVSEHPDQDALNPRNALMSRWFSEKCQIDSTFC
ncbi:probable tubulin polyglutamylase ttll-15 [Phlebotomus argentipes]|uniref:probable tubulin polyglutamylase ttll-15 n=1 Tax=Phlebotomus argentipes TaxID=94469 RepID=UPI002892BA44|nr:probable tubulin polyglutamylase ttll-15 [Phlebotomus argentipes]